MKHVISSRYKSIKATWRNDCRGCEERYNEHQPSEDLKFGEIKEAQELSNSKKSSDGGEPDKVRNAAANFLSQVSNKIVHFGNKYNKGEESGEEDEEIDEND